MSNTTQVNAIPNIFSNGVKTSYHRHDGVVVSIFGINNVGYAVFDGNELKFVSESFEQLQDWIMTDVGLLEVFK